MTPAEAAALVRTLKRQLWLARLTRWLLLAIIVLGVIAASREPDAAVQRQRLWTAAMFAGLAWVLLTATSARQVRASNQASVYMSTGRLDLAEEHLKSALQSFSLFKAGKLLVCHNLAVVEHGRKNYSAAAELCDGLLSLGAGLGRGVGRMCRILLADCRLFLGDSLAALRAIDPLHLHAPALNLAEQLLLLPVELRCQIAQGDFARAADDLPRKVRLAELLDSRRAALVHALLARACARLGKSAEARFLDRRAALYHDLEPLRSEYPILAASEGHGPSPLASAPPDSR